MRVSFDGGGGAKGGRPIRTNVPRNVSMDSMDAYIIFRQWTKPSEQNSKQQFIKFEKPLKKKS